VVLVVRHFRKDKAEFEGSSETSETAAPEADAAG
jgi:hypothetical protein